ncbi:MAG: hypothetical protein JST01_18310 [Cyanobacteria bacterium SZAS TMP-1]|nr:hypothetical protein [Cyanobacteria bacterium SZAS TMP-1]
MKFSFPKLKAPSIPDLKIPKHVKWALGITAGLVGLGFAAYFGFYVLMLVIVISGIVGAYWPVLAGYFVAGAVLGAAISHKRSGAWASGLWAGIFYALLSALVGLIACAAYAVSTGMH